MAVGTFVEDPNKDEALRLRRTASGIGSQVVNPGVAQQGSTTAPIAAAGVTGGDWLEQNRDRILALRNGGQVGQTGGNQAVQRQTGTPTITTGMEGIRTITGTGGPAVPDAPNYSATSPADQLRRAQSWSAIRSGMENAGLTPAQVQAMKNNIANRMSSASSSAERMALEQAQRTGTAGGGASDRRLQELAAMNQASASGQMSQIEAGAAQDALNRQLQYAGLGANTASQFGQDELARTALGEQALMDRLKLRESGRQADIGVNTDMYRWLNEQQLLDRYRTQERDEYMPLLEKVTGRKLSSSRSTRPTGYIPGGLGLG